MNSTTSPHRPAAHGYTRKEAARMLGVHHMTLWRWEKAGRIPRATRLTRNNHRVYSTADIAGIREWMEATA